MAIDPDNPAWKRIRPQHHAGAIRSYAREPDDDGYPRGPGVTPRRCSMCDQDSQYDSASPGSDSWYISSNGSSPVTQAPHEGKEVSTFNMKSKDYVY